MQGAASRRRKKYLVKSTPSLKLETAADRAAAEVDMAGEWKELVKRLTIHPPAWSRSAEEDENMLEILSRGVAGIMRKMAPFAKKTLGRPKANDSMFLQCSRMHF
jgi:hypothetical protein